MEEEYQKMQLDRTHGGIASRMPPSPPTPEPDTIEQLLAQVYSQGLDIREAIANMRHQLLGAWPENGNLTPVDKKEPQGLVPKSKEALYRMIDIQREIREHIVAISKGVR